MSVQINEKQLTMSELIQKELVIENGAAKVDKKIMLATLPENITRDQFMGSVNHLSDLNIAVKHALAVKGHEYMTEHRDVESVSAVGSIGDHHKFTATIKREHHFKNPSTGENIVRKGMVEGGFKLNVPSAELKALKESVSALYADL